MDGDMVFIVIACLIFAFCVVGFICSIGSKEPTRRQAPTDPDANKVSCPKCGALVELNNSAALDAGLAIIDPMFAVAKSKIRKPLACPNCGNRWLP